MQEVYELCLEREETTEYPKGLRKEEEQWQIEREKLEREKGEREGVVKSHDMKECYDKLVCFYGQDGNLDGVLRVFERMMADPGLKPDGKTYKNLAKGSRLSAFFLLSLPFLSHSFSIRITNNSTPQSPLFPHPHRF